MSRAPGSAALPGPTSLRENLRLVRRMFDDPTPVLDECAARFGRSFALGVGPLKMAVVGDPADLTEVFAQPNASYRWGHFLNVLGFIVGPTSIIVSDGDLHHRRRSAVQPAFARRRLDGWIPMIVSEADRMIDGRLIPALADPAVGPDGVDLYPLGKDLVLAITVKAFFGNGLEYRTEEIGAIFDELQGYLELPGPKQFPHRIPHTRRARVRAARLAFDRIVDDEVARRRTLAGSGAGSGETGDLLDVFVDDSSDRITDDEVHDQVNTLIGAGYNTTAATLAWTLHRALSSPGTWEGIRAEAADAFGPDGVPEPDPGTLRSLRYTAAVVHEALRLHPAGVIAPRQAVVDVAVGSGLIPANAMVLWSPHLAGRDTATWGDPLVFRPERHLDPTPEHAALAEAAWVPFGRGPRRCIGFALAQMELTLIVARLAQRVDLTLVDPTTPRPVGMVVNRPAAGVPVVSGQPPDRVAVV